MILEDHINTRPFSQAELQRLQERLLRRYQTPTGHEAHESTTNDVMRFAPFDLLSTRPVPSQTLRRKLMSSICAFTLAEWPFGREVSPTHVLDLQHYTLRASEYQPAGISVSKGLIVDRETLKKSILMIPSGLYLTWLEAPEEEVDDFAF